MVFFFIGFMGSGKSTIGKQLAKKLNYNFIDLDELFVKKTNCTIPDFFNKNGEEIFRKKEFSLLREIDFSKNIIISTGGGTPCYKNNMEFIRNIGISIYLKLEPELLCKRLIKSHTIRPMVIGKSETELQIWIENLLNYRKSFYEKAQVIIDARNISISLLLKILQPYLIN